MSIDREFYRALYRLNNTNDGKILNDYLKNTLNEVFISMLYKKDSDLYNLQGKASYIRELLDLLDNSVVHIERLDAQDSLAKDSKNIY
jgi:hypothetical protein